MLKMKFVQMSILERKIHYIPIEIMLKEAITEDISTHVPIPVDLLP